MDIIVLNGFLGSGKTTAISKIIQQFSSQRIALVVNEFGKESIDSLTLKQFNSTITEINNGSIFCSCKSDKFVEEMLKISQRNIDLILVETSGFSNPSSLSKILDFIIEKSDAPMNVKSVMTLVCPKQFPKLSATSTPYQQQLIQADKIIVNKIDLVNEHQIQETVEAIAKINPVADCYQTQFAELNYQQIFSIKSNKPEVSSFTNNRDLSQQSVTFTLKENCSLANFLMILSTLKHRVYRMKGYIKTDEGKKFIQIASEKISVENSERADNKLVILFSSKEIGKKTLIKELKDFTL